MKKVTSIVLNNFKNDSRVLKENISLKNAGYDVKVVALHEEPLKEFDSIQNIPIHRIKLRTRKWSKHKLVQIIKYLEFIYKVVKKYKSSDTVHCNDLNALPVGVIIKKFFNKNLKLVYDAHEYEINDIPNQSKVSIKLKYILEKSLIKYVDKVITVSESIANEYVKLYNIGKPALVLNAPPYKEINKKNLFRKNLGIKDNQTIFLYQGGLSKGRGVEILLDTFISIENENAVIVFMGYGSLENLIKESSDKYRNIYFHEAVAPEILLDYTSSADFGLLFYENNCLNHYLCSPNKMFEYIMAEIPVIISNLYEMRRLVESNKIGTVAKENTLNGLKKAITEAEGLDKEKLKSNIKKVKAIFNWEEQEKNLLEVYRGLG
ncbi:glycosyltransferase [Pseudofrancisella aestuarii]|uniref:Glycosyltransferase n=1 Tax=Pseudofrancisella aestuarii TaxID=2670347 RepID=A0ABV9T9U7_9GAMM|nr:glycosyltransferase [Pseudofrancisella aestuarii]